MITGRVFAARPRSANQTSPGRGFIQDVQNFLLSPAGLHQVQDVLIGQRDYLRDALTNL